MSDTPPESSVPPGPSSGLSGALAAWPTRRRHSGLSLHWRLNALICALMSLFMAALMWQHLEATRDSVREEIVASNRIATQLLQRVSWIVLQAGPQGMLAFLEQLGRVRSNDIVLSADDGEVLYRSPPSAYKQGRQAPAWFATLVAPPIERQVIQLSGARLTVESDPSRAILDGWDEVMRLVVMAALVMLAMVVAVLALVGRALRPFRQIVDALRQMEQGHYGVRLGPLSGREAAWMGEAVNRLGGAIEDQLAQRVATLETEHRLAESQAWARRMEARLEEERREIAAELHDELGQSVTAIRSLARSLVVRLPASDDAGRQAAELIEREAASLYDAMRGLIPRLTPLTLEPLGLPDALTDLMADLRVKHPHMRFSLDLQALMPCAMEPGLALAVYRVVQEAITNALKHSHAKQVSVEVHGKPGDQLEVSVMDDGIGLPPLDAPERGHRFGLVGLRTRVQTLGGTLVAVRASEAGGTRVTAVLPWPSNLSGG